MSYSTSAINFVRESLIRIFEAIDSNCCQVCSVQKKRNGFEPMLRRYDVEGYAELVLLLHLVPVYFVGPLT